MERMLEIAIYSGSQRDNLAVRSLVLRYREERPDLALKVTVCADAETLLNAQGRCICLLDVSLPGVDGLELAAQLREKRKDCVVIFLTSSRRHALEAYQVRALHYLLKPVAEKELFAVLDEATILLNREEARFQVKTAQGIRWLCLPEMIYLRPRQHVVEVYMKDGTCISTQNLRVSFSQFVVPLLESGRFVRPHHSYVVNASYIDHLTQDALLLKDDTAIPVSHSKYRTMKEMF